jgi:hypothetical protein
MKLSVLLNDYINIKKKIDDLNDIIKEKKNELSEKKDTILKYMSNKNLKDLDFNNNKFIVRKTNNYSSLSQKYLKNTINTYFKNNNKEGEQLLKYILNNRDLNIQTDLSILLK